jgi:hypothetical protein
MNLRKLFVAMAGVSAAMLAGTASATDYVSNQAGSWSNSSVWTPNGVPGANDKAQVSHNINVTDSRSIRRLIVDSGKTLHITSTGDLTMTATSSPNGAQIDGTVQITDNFFATASSGSPVTISSTGVILMDGDTPRLRLNKADAVVLDSAGGAAIVVDPTALGSPAQGFAYFETSGSGSLRSDSFSNEVDINMTQAGQAVLQVSSGVELHGAVQILRGTAVSGRDAILDNEGLILADQDDQFGDEILIAVDDAVDASSANCADARWQAAGTGTLEFQNMTPSLTAGFWLGGTGVLLFTNTTLNTTGDLHMNSGSSITADSSSSFDYNAICSGGGNPGHNFTNGTYVAP